MSDLVDNLNALIMQRARSALQILQARGAVPGKTGTGSFKGQEQNSGGGGIAGPLVEITDPQTLRAKRTYYDKVTQIYSNDFLFAIELRPLKTITMQDANKQTVQLQFAVPPDPEIKKPGA